ncbi:uncharacterized protein LAESUDRAFT_764250 [Laetiporus sulphureus 93-53]|uniref:DUF4219 domain-containing protein n=1 Tax=Laetiporus sulphureus 93-53 TaxID=1314785 RepID=A0A165BE80_9APHY|nr:uncharacterized protein LAESUDRAFT_764250 [Laetiporus sulphureus 93-53]KZT00858.1 hypothetical protein LAESUDRAFT_764250 [Laetiporus sulphureus 93-53]
MVNEANSVKFLVLNETNYTDWVMRMEADKKGHTKCECKTVFKEAESSEDEKAKKKDDARMNVLHASEGHIQLF